MKTAIVTGGARGIGLEVSRQLVSQGFKVIGIGRNKNNLDRAEKELGENFIPYRLDLSESDSAEELADFTSLYFEHLDVLVNNAGVLENRNILDFDMKEMRQVMEVNYFAVIAVTGALMPLLTKSREGKIINMSSGMGTMANLNGDQAAYRLSKWNLNGFTLLLANELKNSRIKVNAVSPGHVKTDMGGSGAARSVEEGAETVVWLATENRIPTGKFFKDKREIDW